VTNFGDILAFEKLALGTLCLGDALPRGTGDNFDKILTEALHKCLDSILTETTETESQGC
jgi:hypothetical protein